MKKYIITMIVTDEHNSNDIEDGVLYSNKEYTQKEFNNLCDNVLQNSGEQNLTALATNLVREGGFQTFANEIIESVQANLQFEERYCCEECGREIAAEEFEDQNGLCIYCMDN